MSTAMSNGVRRSLYLQLMPQFYSLDTYPAQPVQDVTLIGTFYRTYELAFVADNLGTGWPTTTRTSSTRACGSHDQLFESMVRRRSL